MKLNSKRYWELVRLMAERLNSDGCSGVPEFYHDCCLEHDIHYRTHFTLLNQPISRSEADRLFRKCMQQRSSFGVWSPMAWWRWIGVRMFGKRAYEQSRT